MDKVFFRNIEGSSLGLKEIIILRSGCQTVIFFSGISFYLKDRKEIDLSLFEEIDISFDGDRKRATLIDIRDSIDDDNYYLYFDNSSFININISPVGGPDGSLGQIIRVYTFEDKKIMIPGIGKNRYDFFKEFYLEADIYEDLNVDEWGK
ncbi:hypothetical protein [Saprospira grandis]|uniref:Uncharacterized protein n=1 Tax=Saprospira grandis (strain Lewin) TaxID=984262 RepID=H6L2X5_SAPGL|nr:hypothetical protein [Saprospira grandis]AFC23702.1 hypothetical protein SGRA_0966 [Saprospira grandis str. Lewin]